MIEKQKRLSGIAFFLFAGAYFGLTVARRVDWVPESWSLIAVVETAWLNFLVVLAVLIWIGIAKIPFSRIGLAAFQPSRTLLIWVVGTIAVDTVAVGIAAPILTSVFGDAPQVARFADVPGNLRLLLMLLPLAWLFTAIRDPLKRYPSALVVPFTVLRFYWQKEICSQSLSRTGLTTPLDSYCCTPE